MQLETPPFLPEHGVFSAKVDADSNAVKKRTKNRIISPLMDVNIYCDIKHQHLTPSMYNHFLI